MVNRFAISLFCLTGLLITPVLLAQPEDSSPIRRKARQCIERLYADTDARLEIEWVSRQTDWHPGGMVDSITVQYARNVRPRGQTTLRIEAWQHGRPIRRKSYAVFVRVFQPVLVSLTDIRAQQPLTLHQFTLAERDITRIKGEAATTLSAVSGMQSRRKIHKNDILTDALLMPTPLIQRGEWVTLVYDTPTISLEMEARALQNGAAGEIIWCISSDKSRRYRARVQETARAVLIP